MQELATTELYGPTYYMNSNSEQLSDVRDVHAHESVHIFGASVLDFMPPMLASGTTLAMTCNTSCIRIPLEFAAATAATTEFPHAPSPSSCHVHGMSDRM